MRYWAKLNERGNIVAVECYSHDLDLSDRLVEISEREFNDFISAIRIPAPKHINYRKLVDVLVAKGIITEEEVLEE